MTRLCRFVDREERTGIGLLEESEVVDVSAAGLTEWSSLWEQENWLPQLAELARAKLPRCARGAVRLLAPVERQEVWAAGVTYLRSKHARMDESAFSATAYDRVYEAARPELFFKALPDKVAGPGEPVGIRRDSTWSVPEPELALVLNSRGQIAGYTIGNDMSARDIEGENLLYLPQAKIYDHSCALGPCIGVGVDEATVRTWQIELTIRRAGQPVFSGAVEVGRIKRRFDELAQHLCRCQCFPHGAVLLTGTGIVPPDGFALRPGDQVAIGVSGLGRLENPVELV